MENSEQNLGGTTRLRLPAETLQIIKPYVQQAGITRIANLTYLDCIQVPVYTCFRPASKNLATSQGKGLTDDLAKCSAYMEAIEHYYSESLAPDLTHIPTSTDPRFIHAKQLPKGMVRYTTKAAAAIQAWSTVHSLLTDNAYFAPTYYLNFDLSIPHKEDGLFRKTTTGLASGNHRIEALCHALYEIVERHHLHRFEHYTFAQKTKRLIDVATVDYPPAKALLERLKALHITVAIFDLAGAFAIPTYHCLIAEESPLRKLGHYSGSGAHYHKGIALCRAITEAIQSRLTYIAGSRDDMFPKDYKATWQPLTVTGKVPYRKRQDDPSLSIHDQYQKLLQSFQQKSFDIVAREYTKPTDQISVVHALVPGLAV